MAGMLLAALDQTIVATALPMIGGLFSSTLLALVVVSAVFSLVDGFKMRFSRQPSSGHFANSDV